MPKQDTEERATGIEGVIERSKESAKAENIQGFIDYVQENGGPKLNAVAVAIAVRGYKYFQASRRDGAGTAKKATAKKATAKKTAAAKKTAKKTTRKATAKKTTKRVGRPRKATASANATTESPQADAEF